MPRLTLSGEGDDLWSKFTDFENNWKRLSAVDHREMTGERSWHEKRGKQEFDLEVVEWNPETSFTIHNHAGGVLWVTVATFTEGKVEFEVSWKTWNPIMLLMTPLIKSMMRKGMKQDISETITG